MTPYTPPAAPTATPPPIEHRTRGRIAAARWHARRVVDEVIALGEQRAEPA